MRRELDGRLHGLDMNTETKVYLKKRFKEYYWSHEVAAPSEVHRREFGVGTLEDKIKFRHKAFKSGKELGQFLRTEAPYYISYSAAYYEYPGQPMGEKCWLGADLIFDLDMPMPLLDHGRLEEVKGEAKALAEFLVEDFGFSPQDMRVNFSGSKGYHIHVVSEDVRTLSADARKEIVDYIAGVGLDVAYFIRETGGADGVKWGRTSPRVVSGGRVGPTAGSTGWAGRIYRVAESVIRMPPAKLMEFEGVGEKTAMKVAGNREHYLKLLADGRWDLLWAELRGGIQKSIYSEAVQVTDEDRQVTGDVSRLIRLPDTIHGGSGLLARRVADLDSFNPLTDAVAFTGGDVKARMLSDVGVFDLMGRRFGGYKASEDVALPECAGIYLMLKGLAECSGRTP